MSGGNVRDIGQSQRDCVLQPKVARNELPWVTVRKSIPTATRLWPIRLNHRGTLATTPLALFSFCDREPKVGTDAPTLGWRLMPRYGIRFAAREYADYAIPFELANRHDLNILALCPNPFLRFTFIWYFQRKTVAHSCATNRRARRCTHISAAFPNNWIALPSKSEAWRITCMCWRG